MKKILTSLLVSTFFFNILPHTAQAEDWYVPSKGATWHWQLSGTVKPVHNVELYDIDLFDTPQKTIDALHKKNIRVICYFSAGSVEAYRDDAKQFPKDIIGKTLNGWPKERWLDIAHFESFADIMKKRLDLAVQKGCDGVEPDNVDGFENKTGFPLTYSDQIRYNTWLAEEAHARGLSIGLKNNLSQVKDLVHVFDFAVNEQCVEYQECDMLKPFLDQGKAVLHAEYHVAKKKFCQKSLEAGMSSMKLHLQLNGKRDACTP